MRPLCGPGEWLFNAQQGSMSVFSQLMLPEGLGFFFFLFLIFLGLYLRHMEVPRLGVESAGAAGLYHRHSNARSEPHL